MGASLPATRLRQQPLRETAMIFTIAVVMALVVASLLLLAIFWGGRRRLSRRSKLLLLGIAFLLAMAPGIAWAWSQASTPALNRQEQVLAVNYRGKYGGLTIHHSFGSGKSRYNAPDILEAGGYIRDVTYTPDGMHVDSFFIHTLQGKKFKFLVRPEIVPMNEELWNVEHFQVYSQCHCMVALHFTIQPVGNVVIILFAVEQPPLE